MTFEMRREALSLAREITPPSDAATLIANATRIEAYLRGEADAPTTFDGSAATTVAYNAVGWDTPLGKTPEHTDPRTWSGTGLDLNVLLDNGSTMICKARNIGMTSFLIEYAANKTRNHETVLWFSANGRGADEARKLIGENRGNTALVDLGGLNRFADEEDGVTVTPKQRGCRYDHIIVDGMAFLPYGKEADFLSTVMPMSQHFVFASEPGQKRGLFYDLWLNSPSYQKVMLTWHTPLYPAKPDALAQAQKLRESLGEDRFRNQFECVFREVTDE
jgi:hypothetical protein